MIAQLLNRRFVLDVLEDVNQRLQEDAANPPAARRGEALPTEPGDYREAHGELSAALEREKSESSIPPSFEPPRAERRGEDWPELEDYSFFSRDPILSIAQSVLEDYYEAHPEEGLQEAPAEDDERRGPGEEVVIAARSLPVPPRRTEDNRRLFGRFEVTDPGWISSAIAMGIRQFRKRFGPFPAAPAEPARIADNARLILVGDWGSGIPRAQRIGQEMRKYIDGAGGRETHVIHLGDVYYSGFGSEYEKRFFPYWPVKSGEEGRIGSWILNGNHDMYAGGHAYFNDVLTESRFRRHGGCSFFGLFNTHWDIFGLDTGYEDGGLEGPQADWVLARMALSGRKAMLLSHHQLFSAFEKPSQTLVTKAAPIVATGRVGAWFWGHEHRCCVFRRGTENVGYAACIGHGGVPVYMNHADGDAMPGNLEFEYRKFIRKGLEKWALFGFTVLDFRGDGSVDAIYVDEDGDAHRKEPFA